MSNLKHLETLKKGVSAWNQWREANPEIEPDLSLADLSGEDLSEANLSRTNLGLANLSETTLAWTNLSGAILDWANLGGTTFNYTDFSAADMEGAVLFETIFIDSNLKGAKCLDKCHHKGQSSIDHRTLQQSGKLSPAFLRGCGMADELITAQQKLSAEPSNCSVHISFSQDDKDLADFLYEDLQNNGFRCWHAPNNMQLGKKVPDAIQNGDKLLIILSRNSLNSDWVKTEIGKACKLEQSDSQRALFPISLIDLEALQQWECLDADSGADLAKKVMEHPITEFRNWRRLEAYQESFSKLLGELKAPHKTAGPGAQTPINPLSLTVAAGSAYHPN